MKKKVKKKPQRKRVSVEQQQANNRRKFLDKLDPKTRDYAVAQFAMLGLYQ